MTFPADYYVPADLVVDGVYISGAGVVRYASTLQTLGIIYVLKLYEGEPNFPQPFQVLYLPLFDGTPIRPDDLERGTRFIREQVEANRKVLVMCGAGISRSATFVLSYLIGAGMTLRAAYMLLQSRHKYAAPHPALLTSLIEYYKLPDNATDVIRTLYPH